MAVRSQNPGRGATRPNILTSRARSARYLRGLSRSGEEVEVKDLRLIERQKTFSGRRGPVDRAEFISLKV